MWGRWMGQKMAKKIGYSLWMAPKIKILCTNCKNSWKCVILTIRRCIFLIQTLYYLLYSRNFKLDLYEKKKISIKKLT